MIRSPLPNTTTLVRIATLEESWIAVPMKSVTERHRDGECQETSCSKRSIVAGSTRMRILFCALIADHLHKDAIVCFHLSRRKWWRRLWRHRIVVMTATRSRRFTVQERQELVLCTQTENRYSTRTDWTPTRQERCVKSLDQPTLILHASNPSSITATTRHIDGLFKLLLGHWDWRLRNASYHLHQITFYYYKYDFTFKLV